MLLGGDVVAQHEVQLKRLPAPPRDRSDRVVRLAIGFGEDKGILIGVAAPRAQNAIGQLHEPRRIGTRNPDHGHRPLDDPGAHILKALKLHGPLNLGALHGELEVPALEVIVGQDRSAHDWQIRIGPHEVVRELPHEVQQLGKTRPIDLHRGVLLIEHDAVLVVVHVGRILQVPRRIVDGDGNHAMVLARRVVDAPGISLVLHAQQALGIAAGG